MSGYSDKETELFMEDLQNSSGGINVKDLA